MRTKRKRLLKTKKRYRKKTNRRKKGGANEPLSHTNYDKLKSELRTYKFTPSEYSNIGKYKIGKEITRGKNGVIYAVVGDDSSIIKVVQTTLNKIKQHPCGHRTKTGNR